VKRGIVFVMLLACSSNEPSDDGGVDAPASSDGPIDAPAKDAAFDATVKDASADVDATLGDATVVDATVDASSDSTISDTSINDVTITDASVYDGPCNDAAVDGASVQLATLQFPLTIAIDGTYVYWGGPSLRRCAIGGCGGNPTTLLTLPVSDFAGGIAVDTTNVYATVSTGVPDASTSYVMSCATNGCDGGVVLAGGQQQMFAIAIDTNNVYWTDFAAGNVMSCAKTGCNGTPTTIASGQNGPWGIAVDGTTVYWGNTGLNGDAGAGLMSCPTTGCDGGVTQLATYATIAVAARNGQVYFTIGTGVGGYVMKIASDGGLVPLSGLEEQPDNLALDDTNVYWTNDINPGYVRECNVNGCCQTPRDIAEQNTPRGIAVDSTHIFWANGGTFDIVQFTPQ
jgi:hypothetical protein